MSKVLHHAAIKSALSNFNSQYLRDNRILFGGGTRIALEIDEFRKSIDIDFVCPDKASYRAVRTQVNTGSLGQLVDAPFSYPREIRADRDAVRSLIKIDDTVIKLEFISFDDYSLHAEPGLKWGVPVLDRDSCFITKLLANADRYGVEPRKDIVDLIMMYCKWGSPSERVWDEVDRHYGTVAMDNLMSALNIVIDNPSALNHTVQVCDMDSNVVVKLKGAAELWLDELEFDSTPRIRP